MTARRKSRRDGCPARIPRRRAVAALELATKVLDMADDLDVEAQPGGFNHGCDDWDVAVGADTWDSWAKLAKRAVGTR